MPCAHGCKGRAWRAVSADRTLSRLGNVNALATQALRESQSLEERRVVAPLQALGFQRDLLQIQADVAKLQRELVLAKRQLAALMNLLPEKDYTLVLPDRTESVPELPGSTTEMVRTALQLRPELREGRWRGLRLARVQCLSVWACLRRSHEK